MHSAFREAAESENLSFVKVKADIFELAGHGDILYAENYLICSSAVVVCAVIGVSDFTSYHQAFDVVLVHVFCVYGVDVFAVAENAYCVAVCQNFGQVVAYEDYASAVSLNSVHNLIQLKPSVL